MFNPYARPTYTVLETNQLDAGYKNIKLLGRCTQKIMVKQQVVYMTRTFNDAVMIYGKLRLVHGNNVKIEQFDLKIVK